MINGPTPVTGHNYLLTVRAGACERTRREFALNLEIVSRITLVGKRGPYNSLLSLQGILVAE